ncbi:G-patch domain containing protein, expressed [Zostera marina]|uniref:G-patch domain containing protein, expressed n=1 Tax=Zostera marina TaxID=29655 RepID=A0A0K9Q170_ZOSMR|nr:G-patch domain containing protein, expressed [Zostera marina]
MEGGMSSSAIDSSNVGFKMLKKCGWREGTGLGISGQGRLEPVEAHVKNNKTGLGADKIQTKLKHRSKQSSKELQSEKDILKPKKKTKAMSKRLRKMLEEDERMKEKQFQQAFFREFWPDNV